MMKVMKILVYLDLCCYCRQFDLQTNEEVAEETKAVEEIFKLIKGGDIELVWSYILTAENDNCKNQDARTKVAQWKNYATVFVDYSQEIDNIAKPVLLTGVHPADALHVACAIHAQANFFVSTDKRLLKYTDKNVFVCNPVQCINILNKIV